jgi:hypothetical protein
MTKTPKPNRSPNFAFGKGAICPTCGRGFAVSIKDQLSREGTPDGYSLQLSDQAYRLHYSMDHIR